MRRTPGDKMKNSSPATRRDILIIRSVILLAGSRWVIIHASSLAAGPCIHTRNTIVTDCAVGALALQWIFEATLESLHGRCQEIADRDEDNRMNCRGGHRGLTRGKQTLRARGNCQENARRQNEEQQTCNKERYHYIWLEEINILHLFHQ